MKEPFVTKMTLRLYDQKLINRLNESYEASGERYESKNHFLTELIKRGYEELAQEQGLRNKSDRTEHSNVESNIILQIHELVGELYLYNKRQVEEIVSRFGISEKLMTAVYNMLIAIVNDERISTKQVEEGFYDELPNRLKKELEKIRDETRKRWRNR